MNTQNFIIFFICLLFFLAIGLRHVKEEKLVTIIDLGSTEDKIIMRYQQKKYGYPFAFQDKFELQENRVGKPRQELINKARQEAESVKNELEKNSVSYINLFFNI